MEYYKLRIDYNADNLPQIKELQSRYFSRFVKAEEKGEEKDNPHLHYYLATTHKASAIRQFIRKHFGSGGGVYSLKKLDEEYPLEYLAYLVKEDPETIWFRMPEGLKEKAIAYDLEVKRDLKTKGSLGKVKKYLIDKYGGIPPHRKTLINSLINYYQERNLLIRKFNLLTLTQTLLLEIDPSYRRSFVEDIEASL